MIKFITSILSLLWVLLAGTPNIKNDLRKQPTKEETKMNLSRLFYMNIDYIALAAILILLVFFVVFCFWIVGVSAVESGNYYNHLGGVI